jgi:hypothetical protein
VLTLFEKFYNTNIYCGKVRDLCSEDRSSAVPDRLAARPKPAQAAQPTASDILRLNRPRTVGRQAISLEMEVDQYLSNPNSGTSILGFWQVVLILTNYL